MFPLFSGLFICIILAPDISDSPSFPFSSFRPSNVRIHLYHLSALCDKSLLDLKQISYLFYPNLLGDLIIAHLFQISIALEKLVLFLEKY